MAILLFKPTTSGRRFASKVDRSELSTNRPYKKLLVRKVRGSGRNNEGTITVRHRGGEHKRFYRLIDNGRHRYDQPARVLSVEYDPNRTGWIALVEYPDKQKQYILAPQGVVPGDQLVASQANAVIKVGNRVPLAKIPVGMMIHDVEITPASRGTMVRSAGTGAIIEVIEGDYAQLKLPSGEIRRFRKECLATIGQVSNIDHQNVRYGKAGRKRWKGIKPSVRGKAMNPVDHPHGGGEGHNPIGLKHPKTPWGKPALGVKTRKKGKYSDNFIIRRRK